MEIRYDERGLVPAVVQHAYTGEVLMQAYMNQEALELTLQTGKATFSAVPGNSCGSRVRPRATPSR